MHKNDFRFLPLIVCLLMAGGVHSADAPAFTEEHWRIALKGGHRDAEQGLRDLHRHPRETLELFGIKPGMKVLEILPGRGWYTAILAPLLSGRGQLTVADFGPNAPEEYQRKIHKAYMAMLESAPEAYGKVVRTAWHGGAGVLAEVEDSSQDMVLTFRNTHHWIRKGQAEEIYRGFHRALKPGGVLGVVQHRAPDGGEAVEWSAKGYVPEKHLIQLLEGIGFELVEKSEINANPKDTKDYPKGVWSLPPSLRLGSQDRERYLAIGESDRMTLKFIKIP